jgi:hypothetical protein
MSKLTEAQRRDRIFSWADWERDVLESADENGVVHPLATIPHLAGIGRLQGMIIDGRLARRDGREGGPYVVTEAGRTLLSTTKDEGR